MTYYTLTEKQVQESVSGGRPKTTVSAAIQEADKIASEGNCNMTVVETVDDGVCIFSDFQLSVLKNEIIDQIYSTDNGFIYKSAA